MNIASIDIGSNTVLLLIASINGKVLNPIINEYNSPRLSQGLEIGGLIKKDRIDHLIQILKKYKNIAEKYNCERIISTATNAMRIASNSLEIIDHVTNELGFDISVVSGEEEAELSFLGASSSLPYIKDKVVIDIGGGSTEIVYGTIEEILFKKSFETGVVSLTEKFFKSFPYQKDLIRETDEYLHHIFNIIESEIPKGIATIAVAGTPTTLSCIKQNIQNYDEEKVQDSILTIQDLLSLNEKLSSLSPEEVKQKFGQVVHGREDVLFAGLLILQKIAKLNRSDIINVSSRGIRYGNIIKYINDLK